MVIDQGDVFWAVLGPARDSTPAGRRPVVVVQCDPLNRSRLQTVVAVALTTNAALRHVSGNVAFKRGEANLPRSCAANVTQIVTLDRRRLLEKIGTISGLKLRAVIGGIEMVLHGAG